MVKSGFVPSSFVCLCALTCFGASWAVPPSVTNVRSSQRADGSGMVDILYDLSDGTAPMIVTSGTQMK